MKEKKYMDLDMLINYIPLTKSTVYSKVSRKEIPFKKIGKKLVFDKDDIDLWVDNGGEMLIEEEVPEFNFK